MARKVWKRQDIKNWDGNLADYWKSRKNSLPKKLKNYPGSKMINIGM